MDYQNITIENVDNFIKKANSLKETNFNEYFILILQCSNIKNEDLCNLYWNEIIEKLHFDKTFMDFIFETSQNENNTYSINILGLMYTDGEGVKQNYKKAIELFEKEIEKGDSNAMNNLANLYEYVEQNYEKAIELYEKAIEKDNVSAMNNLALMYVYGKGIKQNYQKAIELYEKAIEKGSYGAINNLAHLYENCQGKKNYQKAIELYEKAIEKEYDLAMNNLANMYLFGKGVDINYQKAIEFFERAIEKGNSIAIYNLAYMYHNGEGVAQNYKKAIELYKKAIEKGDSDAMNNLACMYYNGEGVKQNLFKATNLYLKSNTKSDFLKLFPQIYAQNMNTLSDDDKKEFMEIMMNENLDNMYPDGLPLVISILRNTLKKNIDLMELHFEYSEKGKGFQEAKNDYLNQVCLLKN